jgi:hypothetical protein
MLGLLLGESPWPETEYGFDVGRSIAVGRFEVLAEVLTKEDVPALERALESCRGGRPWDDSAQAHVVLLAVDLDPARAEAMMVHHLERNPRQAELAQRLFRMRGPKHWDLVQRSYHACSYHSDREEIIYAVSMLTVGRKRYLSELFALYDLDTQGYEHQAADWAGRQRLLRAFAAAAENANDRQPVVAADLLGRAMYQSTMGAPVPAMQEHNEQVPQARAEAIGILTEFFES